jgi:hypothetical protein
MTIKILKDVQNGKLKFEVKSAIKKHHIFISENEKVLVFDEKKKGNFIFNRHV